MNSYYKCASGGRSVTVWPCCSGESGFYDVVYGNIGDEPGMRTVVRITAFEAASYVVTELGAPASTTLNALEGMIRRWREEYDAEMVDAS